MTAENKAMVVHFYEELFGNGNLAAIDEFIRPDYIDHDPDSPGGPEPLRKLVSGFQTGYPDMLFTIERVLADGDLVLLHVHAVLEPGTPGQAIAAVFRIQDGKIAEHWEARQDVPQTTVSGNDMFATLSAPPVKSPDPLASAAATRKIATALFHEVTVERDVTAFARYLADPYYQHYPQDHNGAAAATASFAATLAAYPGLTVTTKRVIADGDYVAFHSHYQLSADDLGTAVVDLYRVRDGKVLEHWNVTQAVAATSANDNTMF